MIDRIKELIRYKGLSASKFADDIGVQRSGISHILSGRNKPSLEFVLKIIDAYPEVNTEWLLKGKGKMLGVQNDLFSEMETKPDHDIIKNDKKAALPKETTVKSNYKPQDNSASEIDRIIIFYKDNSFKEYDSSR